jgi:hypothetical protein
MPSRSPNALRLNVAGLPGHCFLDYLMAARWSYSLKPIQSLIFTLTDLTQELVLCLDLTDRLLPRIGIECILYHQPRNEPRWTQLLAHLSDLGICTRAKQQALMTWHGDTLKSQVPNAWPRNLSWGDQLLGHAAISTFYRYVSHLKVVYQPGRPLESKAYLGFGHQWVNATDVVANAQLKADHAH